MDTKLTDLIHQLHEEQGDFCGSLDRCTHTMNQLSNQLDELEKRRNFILSIQSEVSANYKAMQKDFIKLNHTIKQVVNTYIEQNPE